MHDQGTGAPPAPDNVEEWQTRVVDMVEDVVTTTHDRFIRPLIVVSRGIVFGILVAAMALVVLILFCVAVLRFFDVYLFPGRVWASYAVLGILFTAVGILAWSKRRPSGDTGAP